MTTSTNTVTVLGTDKESSSSFPKAETVSVTVMRRENCCPLCSALNPVVILSGATRSLAKCPNCRVVFHQPWLSQKELSRLFSEEYISTEEDVEIKFGTRSETNYSRVSRFIHGRKTGGRVLDLGCAGGHFLDRFFPTPVWERWGVDLSKFAAAKAATKSIQVHHGNIQSAPLPEVSFDVVTVLDTFYYFQEPWKELSAIRRIMKPDGLLVIVVPYAGAQIWRNTGWRSKLFAWSKRPLLDSIHLYFYDPASMAFALRSSGFEITAQQVMPSVDQGRLLRNLIVNGYYWVSAATWCLSSKRLMLGPRFLVAATPQMQQVA